MSLPVINLAQAKSKETAESSNPWITSRIPCSVGVHLRASFLGCSGATDGVWPGALEWHLNDSFLLFVSRYFAVLRSERRVPRPPALGEGPHEPGSAKEGRPVVMRRLAPPCSAGSPVATC